MDPEPIRIPRPVLAETIDLVADRADEGTASRALDWLLDRPNVTIADTVHVPAVRDIYHEAEGTLSLTDAFVVQTCRALGADPLANDERIVSRA